MSYSRPITVFTPDGHLLQLEYADDAVHRGSTSLMSKFDGGVIVMSERKSLKTLQAPEHNRHIKDVFDNIKIAGSGFQSDYNALARKAQLKAQLFCYHYDTEPQISQICELMREEVHLATVEGGARPYGVCLIIFGFDLGGKPHIYKIEPSGVAAEYHAVTQGASREQLSTSLQNMGREDNSFDAVMNRCIKVITEIVEPSEKSIEIYVLNKEGGRYLSNEEVKGYLASNIREEN